MAVKLYTSRAWLMMEMACKTPEQIAKEQKTTAQTIYNWIERHGLTRKLK